MDRVGCGKDDRGNNNIQKKDERSWTLHIRKYRYAHCNDLAVSRLHNLHVCWKKRYPEIYKNKLSQFNYSFLDPHRTNLLWHNNQSTYRSNIWWLFCVENHFIKCSVVICCFCTYKIRWTKLRCWSWYITCMIVWLLYTIRIYSNNTKQEINMILIHLFMLLLFFGIVHIMCT